MPIIQITEPAAEPVSVSEVLDAARCGAAFTAQATIIIKALRRHAEARLGRALISQTVALVIDAFPCGAIDLWLPGVQKISAVKYIAPSGVETTLDPSVYELDKFSTPSRLLLAWSRSWPQARDSANAVRIEFVVGYGDAPADVDEDIRLWIITYATQALNNPDGLVDQQFRPLPFVDRLLDPHIVYRAA
jgi:uncharacterized phiE125 gp8 family phage protein